MSRDTLELGTQQAYRPTSLQILSSCKEDSNFGSTCTCRLAVNISPCVSSADGAVIKVKERGYGQRKQKKKQNRVTFEGRGTERNQKSRRKRDLVTKLSALFYTLLLLDGRVTNTWRKDTVRKMNVKKNQRKKLGKEKLEAKEIKERREQRKEYMNKQKIETE